MNRIGLARTRGRQIGLALTAVIVGLTTAATAAAPPERYKLADLKALEQAFVDLAETVQPAVVAIRTYKSPTIDQAEPALVLRPYSQGSGFILDSDGYIVTNRHVVAGADVISVILNEGIKYDATLVEGDPRSDLAVIKIDENHLPTAPLGDASALKTNQWVFAGGNPFGLANEDGRASVTYGVVSALGRQMTHRLVGNSEVEYYGNMIETSAAINPGSSGGPLFNLDGEVVGVVTAIETSSGVNEGHGFAIPMDKNIRRIIETLQRGETVRYGFLGVTVQDVPAPASKLVVDTRTYMGAVIQSISSREGPAARAGLRPGDVVIEYDGKPVRNMDHLVRMVGFTPVGRTVEVKFLRRGTKQATEVTVGDRFEMLSRANGQE